MWQAAWRWVQREHEQSLDEAQRDALLRWRDEHPSHRLAHDQASRLWLLSGLVPPVHGSGDDDSRQD